MTEVVGQWRHRAIHTSGSPSWTQNRTRWWTPLSAQDEDKFAPVKIKPDQWAN